MIPNKLSLDFTYGPAKSCNFKKKEIKVYEIKLDLDLYIIIFGFFINLN